MGIPLEVKWVDQSGPPETHQRIINIGGDSMDLQWHHSQIQAVEAIERDRFTYFAKRGARGVRLSIGLTSTGDKYLTVLAIDGDLQFLMGLPGSRQPSGGLMPARG